MTTTDEFLGAAQQELDKSIDTPVAAAGSNAATVTDTEVRGADGVSAIARS